MDLLPMVFASGWASGVNAYLVVLVLGIVGRTADVEQIPHVLTRLDVLIVFGVLYAMEFVADKIPYLDSTWDAVSTAIRPTVGAVIAVLISGDASTLEQAVYAVVGGGTALASHSVKAGTRLAINSSPEPVTNSVASVSEDVAVAGVMMLVIYHPWIAMAIAAFLLVAGLSLLYLISRRVRRGWRRWKGRGRADRPDAVT